MTQDTYDISYTPCACPILFTIAACFINDWSNGSRADGIGPIIPALHVYPNGDINGVSVDFDIISSLTDTPLTTNGGHDSPSILSSLIIQLNNTNIFNETNTTIKSIKHFPIIPYLSNALFIERNLINDDKYIVITIKITNNNNLLILDTDFFGVFIIENII